MRYFSSDPKNRGGREHERSSNGRRGLVNLREKRRHGGIQAFPARSMQSADVEDHAVIDRLQRGVGEAPHRPVRVTVAVVATAVVAAAAIGCTAASRPSLPTQ